LDDVGLEEERGTRNGKIIADERMGNGSVSITKGL